MASEITRRELVKRGIAGAAAVSVAGVVSGSAIGAPLKAVQPAAQLRRSARRTSLIVLEATGAPGCDIDGPAVSNPGTHQLVAQLYRTLIDYQRVQRGDALVPQLTKLRGELVDSWSKKGLVWTFKLRKGVVSCAGNELTADDVVWTFARGKSVSGSTPCSWFLSNVAGLMGAEVFDPKAPKDAKELKGEVVARDRYTVQFKQYEANALFPSVLAVFCHNIFDSTLAKQKATATDPWAHEYINSGGGAGFGAYCLKDWKKGTEAVLEANPNWWHRAPDFKDVTIRTVPSSSNRIAALYSGAADVITGLSPQEFNSVRRSGKAKVLSSFTNRNLVLGMNYKTAPWDGGGDPAKARLLRQAMAYAMPYNDILANNYFGAGRKWDGLINSSFYGAKRYPGRYVTDIDKSKALLAKAGHPNGKGLEGPGLNLTFVAERAQVFEPTANTIRTALAKVGIDIEFTPISQAEFSDRLSTKYDMPMTLSDLYFAIGSDAGYMTQLFYVSGAKGGITNDVNYSNDQLDKLYFAQRTQSGARRMRTLGSIQDILMNDLPRIPLLELPVLTAIRNDLTGWSPRLDEGMELVNFRNA